MKKVGNRQPCKKEYFQTKLSNVWLTILPSQCDSLEEEIVLHTLDVVTHLGNRWVVSTRIDKGWGIVQHREISFPASSPRIAC